MSKPFEGNMCINILNNLDTINKDCGQLGWNVGLSYLMFLKM